MGHHEGWQDLGSPLAFISDTLIIETGIGYTAIFWLFYVPLILKILANGYFFLWGVLRRVRNRVIPILLQYSIPRELYVIEVSLQDLWQIRTFIRTWDFAVQVYCCLCQVKANRYWLTTLTGIGKNVLHKSFTVKTLFPVWMDVSSVGEVRKAVFWGITMCLEKSKKNLLLLSLVFSLANRNTTRKVQEMMPREL